MSAHRIFKREMYQCLLFYRALAIKMKERAGTNDQRQMLDRTMEPRNCLEAACRVSVILVDVAQDWDY